MQAADADTDTEKTASVEAEPEALETRDELVARSLPEGMASVTAQCAVGQTLYLGGVGQDGAVFARMDAAGEVEMQTLPEPFVMGRDLVAAGVRPGPRFRPVLEKVFDRQLAGAFASREEALACALRLLDSGG